MRCAPLAALALVLTACPAPAPPPRIPEGATVLYDVDFSAPEQTAGAEVQTQPEGSSPTFPSKLPSQIFFGHPMVVPALCGLAKQPAQLKVSTGTDGQEGLAFLLDPRYGKYHVELDLCVQQLGPPPLAAQALQVVVFLDFPQAYGLGFASGGTIAVIDPNLAADALATPQPIARFQQGTPMHVAFDLDLEKQTWHISIDGKTAYDGPLEASVPRSVRVLIRGDFASTAAFDNLLIWAQHELTPAEDVPPPAPVTGSEK
ncbi:MAG: hypothetical protein ACHQ6T_10445 [Myxococcota bacterium]